MNFLIFVVEFCTGRNGKDYWVSFAEETILLLPQFIIDAADLAKIIKDKNHVAED